MSEQVSPLPDVPDVHLRVFVHGVWVDFAAYLTAAPTFIERHRVRHYIDAVNVLPGDTGLPRLPNERLYLSPWDETLTRNVRQRPYGGIGVGNDDQLSMDLGVEVEQTPWGKWVDPDRRAAQIQKFTDCAGISRFPSEPWPENDPELARLDAVVTELFPDMATAMAPENADMADSFICFLGECFIKFTGAHWEDYEWFGRENSFYDDVNPLIEYGFDTGGDTAYGLMKLMIDDYDPDGGGMFSSMAEMLREFADEYALSRNDM